MEREGAFLTLDREEKYLMVKLLYYMDQPHTPSFSTGLVKTEYESLDQLRLT